MRVARGFWLACVAAIAACGAATAPPRARDPIGSCGAECIAALDDELAEVEAARADAWRALPSATACSTDADCERRAPTYPISACCDALGEAAFARAWTDGVDQLHASALCEDVTCPAPMLVDAAHTPRDGWTCHAACVERACDLVCLGPATMIVPR